MFLNCYKKHTQKNIFYIYGLSDIRTLCGGNHCWVKFGGYSTNALAGRLADCEASLLVVGGRIMTAYSTCVCWHD